ncbi:MAG: FAD-binding oxidoreductase [Planctomycetota bacterium]
MTARALRTHLPRDVADLADLLSSRRPDDPPLRVHGEGRSVERLPLPDRDYDVVAMSEQRRILRLAADDLTCSVEAGVRCIDLAAALAEKRLVLPMSIEHATIGSAFADGDSVCDTAGPLGLASPRNLLLGCEGVLGEGKRFKSGARVVKSVAGFDVHKLLVGSRGSLFAATVLHLKLRPAPRASVAFVSDEFDRDRALERFRALRAESSPPAEFWLRFDADTGVARIQGTYQGSAGLVSQRMTMHRLQANEAVSSPLASDSTREHVRGIVPPASAARVLGLISRNTRVALSGGGRLRIDAPATVIDSLLPRLVALDARVEIQGGPAARRGRATPSDAGAARLTERLRDRFDPKRVFA